ncbi:hypothetical protein VDF70_21140 [Xanthomonas campestris pv. raphani]|uniref:hypothetical protein n=1 Tax=Xanthomonas campestris TaxID=339 RepID=UPI002B225835|nr:hypothetical protein [Xanthomonas campestris]MEA9761498.1 hypothetical protein [Xanthomonas campestris pv. raphani]
MALWRDSEKSSAVPINRSTDQPISRSADQPISRSAGLPAIGLAPALFANQMRHGRFTLFDDVASQIHAGNHDAGVQTPLTSTPLPPPICGVERLRNL